MADISEWSPVDESNNQPPPNGFPEFMANSALNNGCRAMMGAVRRWYDAVTAQLASLTTSLAGYLPLSGGVLTGDLAVNGSGGVSISGVQLRNVSGGLDVLTTTGAGGQGIFVHGPESGVFWGDTDQVSPNWGWYATAGTAYFWHSVTGTVVTVTSSGVVSAYVALNTVQYQILGIPFAERVGGTATHIYDVTGNLAVALHAGESYYRADNHRWQNEAATETATLNSSGTLTVLSGVAAPTVSAGTITASGNVNAANVTAAGTVAAVDLNATGTVNTVNLAATNVVTAVGVTASGTVNAATVAATGTVSGNLLSGGSVSSNTTSNALQFNLRSVAFAAMDAGFGATTLHDPNGPNITMYGSAGGTNYYDQTEHRVRNRGGGATYAWFNVSGNFQGDNASAWDTVSDGALKTDVAAYEIGLSAILQLQPISYRFAAGPFDREKIHHGLMAQDVAAVVPEMVGQTELEIDGEMTSVATLNPGNLTYILCNAVKELAARIEALEGDPNV